MPHLAKNLLLIAKLVNQLNNRELDQALNFRISSKRIKFSACEIATDLLQKSCKICSKPYFV